MTVAISSREPGPLVGLDGPGLASPCVFGGVGKGFLWCPIGSGICDSDDEDEGECDEDKGEEKEGGVEVEAATGALE